MGTESIMHLKPWSKEHSRPCGCALERRGDGGVAYMACEAHARAFRAVCAIVAAGQRPTQTDFFRAAHGMDGQPEAPAKAVAHTPSLTYTCGRCGWQHAGSHHCDARCHVCGRGSCMGDHDKREAEDRAWQRGRER